MKMLLGALLFILFSSCGRQGNPEPIVSQIYGGIKANRAQWPSVVSLTLRNQGQFCSGIALGPFTVLTAAHCLTDISDPISDLAIYKGAGKDRKYHGKYHIKYYAHHPDFDPDIQNSPFDFAIIKLESRLPIKSNQFIKVISAIEAMKVLTKRQPIQIIGFGQQDDGSKGRKNSVITSIWQVNDFEFYGGGGGKGSCFGDSGGPVLVTLKNGEIRLIGITSRPSYTNHNCGYGTIFGSINAVSSWLSRYI